jgi:hypothetical protein
MEHGSERLAEDRFLYGISAEFEDADRVIEAARKAREAGYRNVDAYTPFPVEGLTEALGHRDLLVPYIMLIGGILGGIGGLAFLAWSLGMAYPLNVGGRPLYTWPSYIPITFEATVLLSALSGIVGMFLLNGLPAPYHPIFDAPNFDLATSSRFFLCIEANDPKFDRTGTREFMETLGAANVAEVEAKK